MQTTSDEELVEFTNAYFTGADLEAFRLFYEALLVEPELDTSQTHIDILESPSVLLAVPTAQDTVEYSTPSRASEASFNMGNLDTPLEDPCINEYIHYSQAGIDFSDYVWDSGPNRRQPRCRNTN